MANDTSEQLLDSLRSAPPLDRLHFLLDLRALTPALRTEAVRELIDAGWTRYRIADTLGISRQAVYQWETG
jgi:hypothetical protein